MTVLVGLAAYYLDNVTFRALGESDARSALRSSAKPHSAEFILSLPLVLSPQSLGLRTKGLSK